MLMGLLEGYFVPLYNFHLTPTTFEQKVSLILFSFFFLILKKPPFSWIKQSLVIDLLALQS